MDSSLKAHPVAGLLEILLAWQLSAISRQPSAVSSPVSEMAKLMAES
jgi:hypothetical protein